MKRIALMLPLLLVACGTPESTTSSGNGYRVSRLVEFDGCTVYRLDGEYRQVYWTRCKPGDQVTTQSSSGGKTPHILQVRTTE